MNIDRNANWVGQQSQRLQQLGIDPQHAQGAIQGAMRKLLANGGTSVPVRFQGPNGKTYTATMRRKTNQEGALFSDSVGEPFELSVHPDFDQVPASVKAELRGMVWQLHDALGRGDRVGAGRLLEQIGARREDAVQVFCEPVG